MDRIVCVAAPVHQLEQLDRDLDVAQAAGAESRAAAPTCAAGMCSSTARGASPGHVARRTRRARPLDHTDRREDHGDELAAEPKVAGHRPGLQAAPWNSQVFAQRS